MNYFKLIWSNFKRKRLRSWLTVIGILIGITAIISLVALGQGLEKAVSAQFNFLGPDIVTIRLKGDSISGNQIEPLQRYYVDDINKIRGVEDAGGRIMNQVRIEFEDNKGTTMSVGLPYGDKRKFAEETLNFEIYKGRKLDENNKKEMVVGYLFGNPDEMGDNVVDIGDEMKLDGKGFDVVGIAEKKGSFLLDASVYINLEASEELFDRKDEYSHMAARIDDSYDLKEVIERIKKYLRKERDVDEGEEDFEVQSSQAALEQINGIIGGIQIFVYVIAGISILVSGIGIANTMFTSVLERTKDIGVMKATGATNRIIFLLFLFESGLLGTVGGIIGVGIGSALAKGLAFIGQQALGRDLIQAHITPTLILGAIIFSFLIGSISGLIPAIKAAKQHPVEALSYTK